jgi:hypothetical protein
MGELVLGLVFLVVSFLLRVPILDVNALRSSLHGH